MEPGRLTAGRARPSTSKLPANAGVPGVGSHWAVVQLFAALSHFPVMLRVPCGVGWRSRHSRGPFSARTRFHRGAAQEMLVERVSASNMETIDRTVAETVQRPKGGGRLSGHWVTTDPQGRHEHGRRHFSLVTQEPETQISRRSELEKA